MSLFLGIDLGTSYFKAALFDYDGELKGLARRPVQKCETDNSIQELKVDVFWTTLKECIGDAVIMAACRPGDIQAMSYSSQANSIVLLDENNEPLTKIILWTDTRVNQLQPSMQALSDRDDFTDTTGIGGPLSLNTCIAKISWFQEHQPYLWQRVKRIMTISEYLTFILTDETVTDFSTTSLTGYQDIKAKGWWKEALDVANLHQSFLSNPERTGKLIGPITKVGAEKLGLSAGIKFCLGGLDHHMAAIGAGLCQGNNISESTGTVLASVRYINQYEPKKNVFTAQGLDNDHFFQLTYNENGASTLEWYQKNFGNGLTIEELLDDAGTVEPGSSGLFARPVASAFHGLSGFCHKNPYHQHGHYVRAILESTALSLKEIIDVLGPVDAYERIISTGGGAISRLWVQIKSDMTGKEFFIPQYNESACLGAAMLAAISTGLFANIYEASTKWIKRKEIVQPNPVHYRFYAYWMKQAKQAS